MWWAERTGGLPLPLGGNVIRRDLGPEADASGLEHAAREHQARAGPPGSAVEYAKQFGRGLDDARIDRFVGMYVNDLTLDYGERGEKAVQLFMDEAWERRLIPAPVEVVFAE